MTKILSDRAAKMVLMAFDSRRTARDGFEESKHPRSPDGKFGSGGGGGGGGGEKEKKKKYEVFMKDGKAYYRKPDGSEEGPFHSAATAKRSSEIAAKVARGTYLTGKKK